jgi:hypothetical protein
MRKCDKKKCPAWQPGKGVMCGEPCIFVCRDIKNNICLATKKVLLKLHEYTTGEAWERWINEIETAARVLEFRKKRK